MSYAIDANVLLYASDESSRFHRRAVRFLEDCAREPELIYLPWLTVMAYLRIATHPSVFERPLAPDEASGNVEELLRLPHVRPIGEMDGFWRTYRRVTEGVVVRGDLVPDAHMASLLVQNGVTTLWTHDRDFLKFRALRVRDPFA